MATWQTFKDEAPDLAKRTEERFAANLHHVLGTLRTDGSPRLSGTEVKAVEGHLTFGSMTGARKAADLLRDPRCSIHSNPSDEKMTSGDAKVSGAVVEVLAPERDKFVPDEMAGEEFHLFSMQPDLVVLTRVHPDGDRMVIETWTPSAGVRSIDRY